MAFDNFKYSDENVKNIVFPLGGIGAGCIGLGGDGRLQDWEIFNRPNKGTVNGNSHFAIRAEYNGKVVDTRVLHGPYRGELLGQLSGNRFNRFGFGANRSKMTGFPSFEKVVFTGPYPVAVLDFTDKRFPANIQMTALSPFIPLDSQNSSLPVAMFEFSIANTTEYDLDYTLFGCIGFDFKDDAVVDVNTQSGVTSITGSSTCKKNSLDYSEMCIATDTQDTSYQRHAFRGSWFDTLEIYWQDISAGGSLQDRFYAQDTQDMSNDAGGSTEHSILASHIHVKSGETKTVRMSISWYVPNINGGILGEHRINIAQPKCCPDTAWKNYYATQWNGAQHVAWDVFADWQSLQDKTKKFQHVLLSSTLPESIIDAVSSTISVLKTPTALRLEDGTFYGWEGCHDDAGCCEGSCTHVWNYQQALPFLFPDLERGLRTADYVQNQNLDSGGMSFRMALPLGIGANSIRPCCDGQFGNVMCTYRDWKLNGNNAWLESVYPHVKACMEFAWHPDNEDKWDPDQTGVLTGRQHHTLDMELFGPNSWLTGFYLGALKACAEMATAVGDTETNEKYMAIYEKGRTWMHENLFNGSYFYHKLDLSDKSLLTPFEETSASPVVKFNVYDLYWNEQYTQLKYQIGEGCSIDQVLAQFHAGICGLGDIFEK